MTQVQMDWSIQDIADRANLTPRMINLSRARAEARLGHKLGTNPPSLAAPSIKPSWKGETSETETHIADHPCPTALQLRRNRRAGPFPQLCF